MSLLTHFACYCALAAVLLFSALDSHGANLVRTNLAGGDWNTAANWSPSQVPGASDTAWITNSGTYTVTVTTGSTATNVVVGAVSGAQTLNLSGGTLVLGRTATLGTNGTFLLTGGTIHGGTVVATNGASLAIIGGTLDGVTVNGTLEVGNSYNGANLTVANGLVLNGTALVGNPTNGWIGSIGFAGSQTLSGNGTVVFGNHPNNTLFLANAGTTLTNGAGITIRGQTGTIGYGGAPNVAVINQGTISADVSGGTITVNAQSFNNQGLAQGINGGTLSLLGAWSNSGTLVESYGALSLAPVYELA
ncbi:MAG: hypothetical protein WCO56_20345 [Verrucomicrobiota bacterium]